MKILELTEADYGCEERVEGAELMCRIVLQMDDGLIITREIPDALADRLGLVPGMDVEESDLT